MKILLILIIFAILFYFAMKFYQFDNSVFSKKTGYTYLNTLFDSKVKSLKALYDAIYAAEGNQRLLLDVKIDQPSHTNYADVVLIHPSGVYVIQLLQKKGWISGTDKSYEWIEQLHGEKVENFANPIHENLRMIYAIEDLLPEVERNAFQSAIFFSNACSFQHVEISAKAVEVLKFNEIGQWISSLNGEVLSKEQMDNVYNELKSYASKAS